MRDNFGIDVVAVCRHPAMIEYLKEIGLLGCEKCEGGPVPVIAHATADDVRGRHVIGVLPHHLSAEAESVTEIPMDIPPELRGVELSLDQVRRYAGTPVTYVVRRVGEYAGGVASAATTGGIYPCSSAVTVTGH